MRASRERSGCPSFGVTLQAIEGTTNNTTASYVGVPDVDIPRIGGTSDASADGGSWSPSTSMLGAIGGTQEIFDFGRIAAQAAVADRRLRGRASAPNAERLRIDLLVKDAYYGVLGAHAVLRAAEDAFQRAEAPPRHGGRWSQERAARAHRADARRGGPHALRRRRKSAPAGSIESAQAVFAASSASTTLSSTPAARRRAQPRPSLGRGVRKRRGRAIRCSEGGRARAGPRTRSRARCRRRRAPTSSLTATFSGRAGTPSAVERLRCRIDYGPLPTIPNWDVGLVLRWPIYDPVVAAQARRRRQRAPRSRAPMSRSLVAARERDRSASLRGAPGSHRPRSSASSAPSTPLTRTTRRPRRASRRASGTSLELADAEAVRTDVEIQLAVGRYEARRARAALVAPPRRGRVSALERAARETTSR